MPQKHIFQQSAVFSWRTVLDGGKSQVGPEHITWVLHALVEACANRGIFSLSLRDLKTTAIRNEREIVGTQIILAVILTFLKLACFNISYKSHGVRQALSEPELLPLLISAVSDMLEGILNPKNEKSSFTHPYVIPNPLQLFFIQQKRSIEKCWLKVNGEHLLSISKNEKKMDHASCAIF